MAHDERRVSDFWDCTGGNNRFVNMCYPSSKERNDSESDSEIGRASATTTSKESTEPGVELVTSLVTAAQSPPSRPPEQGCHSGFGVGGVALGSPGRVANQGDQSRVAAHCHRKSFLPTGPERWWDCNHSVLRRHKIKPKILLLES